jgi:hypothetical protein
MFPGRRSEGDLSEDISRYLPRLDSKRVRNHPDVGSIRQIVDGFYRSYPHFDWLRCIRRQPLWWPIIAMVAVCLQISAGAFVKRS